MCHFGFVYVNEVRIAYVYINEVRVANVYISGVTYRHLNPIVAGLPVLSTIQPE